MKNFFKLILLFNTLCIADASNDHSPPPPDEVEPAPSLARGQTCRHIRNAPPPAQQEDDDGSDSEAVVVDDPKDLTPPKGDDPKKLTTKPA